MTGISHHALWICLYLCIVVKESINEVKWNSIEKFDSSKSPVLLNTCLMNKHLLGMQFCDMKWGTSNVSFFIRQFNFFTYVFILSISLFALTRFQLL